MPNEENRPEMTAAELSEQEQIRRGKLAALTEAGRDPFLITRYDVTHHSTDAVAEYERLENEFKAAHGDEADAENHENAPKLAVSIAGRMMSRRVMGKASFCHLLDRDGRIQVYVRKDNVGEENYAAFKDLDIGDIIGVKGEMFRASRCARCPKSSTV